MLEDIRYKMTFRDIRTVGYRDLFYPNRIYKNFGCKKGDVLILTKQLGSGIVNTAVKAQMASEAAGKEAVAVMTQLNKKAREILDKFTIHACTTLPGSGFSDIAGKWLRRAERR